MSDEDEVWRHGRIRANGIDVHYVEAGSGPLVLLLHGFPEFWYSWRHQIRALSTRFRVVAPDLRGYNETEKPESGYDVETLVEDAVGLVHALGERECFLVGHDWGGAIAWVAASRRPDVFRRLAVLNGPHPTAFSLDLRSNPAQLLRSWYIFFFQIPWLPELWISRDGFRPFIKGAFRDRMRHPDRLTAEDEDRFRDAIAMPGALTSALEYYRVAFRKAMRAGGEIADVRVDVPTLVIWGEPDFALGRELAENLDRWVPDVRVAFLPASHWVQQDAPDEVNALLHDFFDSAR